MYNENGRGQLKCDGTCTETRFRLSAKRTSPFKSVGASVQLTTGSRGVRINASNAGYTMFRGSVKGTGYPLRSPVSPFTPLPLRHHVPKHFNWSLALCMHETVPSTWSVSMNCMYICMYVCRGQLKCDGTRAETRFRLSAKQTSPFKSAGGRQFSRLLAAEVCASAVVMLDTPCSEVV